MVAAFEFFGAVPREVWWDNPKTVATLILQGRHANPSPLRRARQPLRLRSPLLHAGSGNEKPDAEGTVKAVQRRFATGGSFWGA